ncbi:MAG: response regulator transcription factor, partial [Clostridia bacterium]|nr:response regulator transcription factor [Clostridia bacterium]
ILVVDDDRRINELLDDIFTMEGFEVYRAFDGEEAIEILDNVEDIRVVILDIMMPKIDGWEMLAYIKMHYDVKVLMLTALGEEEDEVRGIRSGADDFVVKPFKRAILLERVKRLVSDIKDRSSVTFVCEDLTLSQSECRAYIKGEPVRMTTKEYQLLLLLMKNAKLALSREAILNKVWGFEYDGNDRTIDTHIKMLRHSLGEYGERIRTIRGMGYSFDGEVKER